MTHTDTDVANLNLVCWNSKVYSAGRNTAFRKAGILDGTVE